MGCKIDLHIHSRHSAQASEWLFRRCGFAPSYTVPQELYVRLKAAGMTCVTITDDDTIAGCMEISHHGDVFISECVSTYFPGSQVKIRLLLWNITERQHDAISELRPNLFDLQKYIVSEGISHAVAHPLYSANGGLELAHLEKLILLFKHFEGLNALRDSLYSEVATFLLQRLTPETIERLSERHQLEPTHAEPWKKVFVAGSEDYSGLFAASAYTECDDVSTLDGFFAEVQAGRCRARGQGGVPLKTSHGLYSTAFACYQQRFAGRSPMLSSPIDKAVMRFLNGDNPADLTLADKLAFAFNSAMSGRLCSLLFSKGTIRLVGALKEISSSALEQEMRCVHANFKTAPERAFAVANLLFNRLARRFCLQVEREVKRGSLPEACQGIFALLPLVGLVSPYFYAFQSQAPNRKWLSEAARALVNEAPESFQRTKRAWFTDTLDDVNGVATTIRKMTAASTAARENLTVVVCRSSISVQGIPVKNFSPIYEFELPEYEFQTLTIPPFLEVLNYIQDEKFTELIISTPGPMGLCALIAGKMLNLPTIGIYHTDFPKYIRILTDDSFLEQLTWKFMYWFYDSQELVYINSKYYRQSWIDRKISAKKLKVLPRGLDTVLFHPNKRERDFFTQYGAAQKTVKLLYTGRISKEKDLDIIVQSYLLLKESFPEIDLIFVGEGPYVSNLKSKAPQAIFTGLLRGEELAKAYASADIFLFPSTTDTFGNAVVEAQASGLPTIVSDVGGPKDLVEHGKNGYITKALDISSFSAAVETFLRSPELCRQMGQNGHLAVQNRSWSNAFKHFWQLSEFGDAKAST